MKNNPLRLLLFVVLVPLFFACKSEFEKIRVSGDTELIYKKAFAYYDAENYQNARTLFELIINSYRGRSEAEKVYFHYAYCHYHLGEYVTGSYYFKNFSNTFPTSLYREEADFLVAMCNYQLSPSFRLDQTSTGKAIEDFQLFVNTHPQSERVAECNRLIDELRLKLETKAYHEAELYYNLENYQAAVQSFENLLRDFPESSDAEKVRYLIAKAKFNWAANSIVDKRRERFQATLDAVNEFLEKYSTSPLAEEIRILQRTAQQNLKKLTNG